MIKPLQLKSPPKKIMNLNARPKFLGVLCELVLGCGQPKRQHLSVREDEKLPIHSGQMAGVIVIHLMMKLIVCFHGCVSNLPNSSKFYLP